MHDTNLNPSVFAVDLVNPYRTYVHDYPEVLFPYPQAAALQARLALRFGAAGTGQGRLHVELGAGSGNFLVEMALRHPQDHFVGFELRYKRLVRSAQKLEREDRSNVWLLKAMGESFHQYCPPQSVDHLYLQFPDPWPRASQWKKRMVSGAFLERLAQVLRPGGVFHLKTDHSGYFLHVLALLNGRQDWRLRAWSNHLHRDVLTQDGRSTDLLAVQVKTEFERLFISQHKPVYYLALEKPL